MTNNDILRRVRYALHANNTTLLRLFGLGGFSISAQDLDGLLRKDEDPHQVPCDDTLIDALLDGLILDRRGPMSEPQQPVKPVSLSNNMVLRKLRIALQLKDTDILLILQAGGHEMSKSELSALFRAPSHRNFMPCRDQILRKFLAGLSKTSREEL